MGMNFQFMFTSLVQCCDLDVIFVICYFLCICTILHFGQDLTIYVTILQFPIFCPLPNPSYDLNFQTNGWNQVFGDATCVYNENNSDNSDLETQ